MAHQNKTNKISTTITRTRQTSIQRHPPVAIMDNNIPVPIPIYEHNQHPRLQEGVLVVRSVGLQRFDITRKSNRMISRSRPGPALTERIG